MTGQLPQLPGALRGVNFRSAGSYDSTPIGTIVLSAGGAPSPQYLAMDGVTQHPAGLYAVLRSKIDPQHLVYDEYDARVIAPNFDSNALFTLVGGIGDDLVALTLNNQDVVSHSSDGGVTWHEQIPYMTRSFISPSGCGRIVKGRGNRLHIGASYQSTTDTVDTFIAPFTSRATLAQSMVGTFGDLATDGAGTLVVVEGSTSGAAPAKSTDDGATFSSSGLATPAASSASWCVVWTGTHWVVSGVVSGVAKIWRSTDLTSWSDVTPGAMPTNANSITYNALVSNGAGRLVLFGQGQVIYSSDHGATWSGVVNVGGSAEVDVVSPANKRLCVWTGKHFWNFNRGRYSTTGATWADAPAHGLARAPFYAYADPGRTVMVMSGPQTGSPNELATWRFKRDKFALVPPIDYLTRLPAAYYVKAL